MPSRNFSAFAAVAVTAVHWPLARRLPLAAVIPDILPHIDPCKSSRLVRDPALYAFAKHIY